MNDARGGGPGRGFWVTLGVIALLGVAALVVLTSRPKSQVTQIDPNLPPLKAEGYVLGSPTAPVEVIEFADFECPACGQFATITEPDVRMRLVDSGKVRVRFIDFPLQMHKNTWDASLAAACANDQGKFWPMHDAIFQNQDRWNGEATSRPRGPLADLAKSIGLDMTKYNACMDSDVHRRQIQANQAEAMRRSVQSTPTFVFNGTMVSSALPYDVYKRHVDEAAARGAADTSRTASSTAGKK